MNDPGNYPIPTLSQPRRSIWKFQLPIDDNAKVMMPLHAQALHVAEQRGDLVLWAIVDVEMPSEERTFHVRGTGHPMQYNEGRYLGTVVMSYGLVWHVFDDQHLAS